MDFHDGSGDDSIFEDILDRFDDGSGGKVCYAV